jgi:hypothetical protein
LVPVIITSGQAVTWQTDGWHLAKVHLVGALQVVLQQQRLKVAALPERETLQRELRQFRVKVSAATGNETFEAWRERDHDDLVLAVALPCWLGECDQPRGIRVLTRRPPSAKRPRIVVCSRTELAGLAIGQRSLLVSVTDPHPVGTGEVPPHALGGLLDALVLPVADNDSEQHQRTWEAPIQPYGRPAAELMLTHEVCKKLWAFLRRRRDPFPDLIIIQDEGDRRALSLGLAVCEGLGLDKDATLYCPSMLDAKFNGMPPPNRHVFEICKAARYMVM